MDHLFNKTMKNTSMMKDYFLPNNILNMQSAGDAHLSPNGCTVVCVVTSAKNNSWIKNIVIIDVYSEGIDLRKMFPKATSVVTELVRDKLQAIQIEGNESINKIIYEITGYF